MKFIKKNEKSKLCKLNTLEIKINNINFKTDNKEF